MYHGIYTGEVFDIDMHCGLDQSMWLGSRDCRSIAAPYCSAFKQSTLDTISHIDD